MWKKIVFFLSLSVFSSCYLCHCLLFYPFCPPLSSTLHLFFNLLDSVPLSTPEQAGAQLPGSGQCPLSLSLTSFSPPFSSALDWWITFKAL